MQRTSEYLHFTPGKPWLEILILFISDLLGFCVTFGLVSFVRFFFLRANIEAVLDPQVIRTILFVTSSSIILLAARGLYPGWGRTSVVELKQIIGALTLAYVLISVVIFVQGTSVRFSRSVFLGSWFFAVLTLPVSRFLVRKLVATFSWWGEPVVVIGEQNGIERVVNLLFSCPRLGLRPVAGLALDCEKPIPVKQSRVLMIPWTPEVQQCYQERGIQTNILAISPSIFRLEYPKIFRQVELNFNKTVFLIQDEIYGSMWAEPVDIAGQPALISHHSLLNPTIRFIKQLSDYMLMLIVTPPVLILSALLAIWIKLDSPGPILYTQERIGKNGKPFQVFKFRTMVENASEVLDKILDKDPAAREEWEKYHKLNEDARITRAGKWIRRLSLDELPQFLNILRGEMSLIGPRPLVQAEINQMGETAHLVLRVRPGLTGWWQVMGRNNISFEDRTKLDVYYVSNWSLWLDLFIFIKTFWVLIFELGGK